MDYQTPRLVECAPDTADASCCTPGVGFVIAHFWLTGVCSVPPTPTPPPLP